MNDCEWIICESSGRWAASIRVAIARQSADPPSAASRRVYSAESSSAECPRLREVRSLEELTTRLDQESQELALMEVHQSNLATVLAWLSGAATAYPQARFIALSDMGNEFLDLALRSDVAAALRAAGAVDVLESPRQSERVLAIGRLHDAARRSRAPDQDADRLTEWAWTLLPWQSADRQVG